MPDETADQLRARLRARKVGRAPSAPLTPDARLVARVCREQAMTRTELAAVLGCVPSALSQGHGPRGLSAKIRAALQRMVAGEKKKEEDA